MENTTSRRLVAKAKVLKNFIEVSDIGAEYEARPLGWNEKGLIGALQTLFTLRYFLYKGEELLSDMRYDDVHDRFVIKKNGNELVIDTSSFTYGGRKYEFKTSMRDLEIIEHADGQKKHVGKGHFSLSSYTVEMESYPDELGDVMKEIAVLYIVKKMTWSMIGPV
jgi:hypothetical protein